MPGPFFVLTVLDLFASSAGEDSVLDYSGEYRMKELRDAGLSYEEAFYYIAMEDYKETIERLKQEGVPENQLPPPPLFDDEFMSKLKMQQTMREEGLLPPLIIPPKTDPYFPRSRGDEAGSYTPQPSFSETLDTNSNNLRRQLEALGHSKDDVDKAVQQFESDERIRVLQGHQPTVIQNNTNNTSVNTQLPPSTRNNDPTLKAAERATF